MPDSHHQVRRVLILTLALNILVAAAKIIIGLVSGALAITADGVHSTIDASSNIVALLANRIADRPPDADHPYGHRRFETLAALGIGLLLLITAWEIASAAISRLTESGAQAEMTPLDFMVMIGTLGVNLFVTTYEKRQGQRLRSQLLIADAAHTRADVYVTVSVLVSMVLVAFGVNWADTVTALVIVVLILRAAWQVLRQSGGVLVDTAPYTPEQLTTLVEAMPSVQRVVRVRSRGPQNGAQVDIDVQVAADMTADHTAAIAEAITRKICENLDGVSEVEVHFVPAHNGEHDYALVARAHADALGLSTHEVRVYDAEPDAGCGKVLEMHVEVPPGQTLAQAHEQVSRLESEVRQDLPDVAEVITHIEPALAEAAAREESQRRLDMVQKQALKLLNHHYPDVNWHAARVSPLNGGFALALHATLPAMITVEAAHRLAEAAEITLRGEIPGLERVTIHTEPPEEND